MISAPTELSRAFECATLVELLRLRAAKQAERTAYTFLEEGEIESDRLSYAELDRRARAIAAALQEHGAEGERVLLLYPPGLEFIAAFFGCLYAGAVAVPAYPPRPNRTLRRLHNVVTDARATAALTTAPVFGRVNPLLAEAPDLKALRWLVSDDIPDELAESWQSPALGAGSLAFLQYTSGSTAAPKGVMVTHGNLLHNERLIQHSFGQTEESVIVGWLPLYHDMGLIGNVLQTLYVGARCLLMSPVAFLQKPFRWLQAVSRYRATTSGGPNFAYDLCVRKITEEQRAALDLRSWEVAFNGAEPVRAETLERFAEAFSPCGFRRTAFFPCYGLAEATLFVSGGQKGVEPSVRSFQASALELNRVVAGEPESEGARTLVSSGRVNDEQKIVIANPLTDELCAPDGVGEIWVSGPSVAEGYWNRPRETGEVFGARLREGGAGTFLRTGDTGFIRDGELFVTGRLKDLIIIRGRNHYPHDIELTAERSHPALRPGCGAAFSVEGPGEERLVIVQEVNPRWSGNAVEILDNIREAIAEEHELQAHAVVLTKAGSTPKTSSGKIQRHACRADFLSGTLEAVAEWKGGDSLAGGTPEALPTTTPQNLEETKHWLAARLAAMLGADVSEIRTDLPVTRYGIDSLTATELAHRIETDLGALVPLATFFQSPSLDQLAEQVWSQLDAAQGVTPTGLEPALETAAEYALSHGQQALYFIHQLAPESPAYNLAYAARLLGASDVATLRQAFQELINRHPALRTTFSATNGRPVQRVHERQEIWFLEEDARHLSEEELGARLAEEANRPFNLARGPLLWLSLFTRPGDERVVLLVVHHIVADFWSLAVLMKEFGQVYTALLSGHPVSLAPPALRYGDYVRWQAGMLEGAEGERLWEYWQKQLAGPLPVLNLPTDKPRPAVQTYRGASHHQRLNASLTRQLKELGRGHDATLYMILLAAFQTLLHRHTGQRDILIGSPAAVRSRAGLSELVGYFVNPLVLRADLSADPPFTELLAQVRRTVLDAFAHQDYPFPLLVEKLHPERDAGRSPLFQVMLAMQKASLLDEAGLSAFALGEGGASLKLGPLTLESVALEQRVAQFDLTLMAAEDGGALSLSWQYNTDLFEPDTVARMAGHFETLLAGVAAEPSQRLSDLPLLTQGERRQILDGWNDTRVDYGSPGSLHGLIEAQAERTPEAVAVTFEEERLTYRELNRRANQLAHYLRGVGVGTETLVGVSMERSVELIVGLLGILKAGAAYVPLDPTYPKERLSYMLDDARVPVLLTQQRLAASPPEHGATVVCLDSDWGRIASEPEGNPTVTVAGGNLAYMIYTSGSTGKPKGAMNTHEAICNRLLWMQEAYGLTPDDRVMQKTPFSFDVSVWEFFWPLLTGARLVVARPGGHQDSDYLVRLINEQQITTLHFVPSMLAVFLEEGGVESCTSLKRVVCSGEALPPDLQERFFARLGASLYNLYGPTEAAVDVTAWTCERGDRRRSVPIGRPIANTQIYLLDERLRPVPVGVAGELHIGGVGLARGYARRPGLTAEKFIPDPFSTNGGARLYKTGDLARHLPGGEIEFLGRIDHQVKVRGFRIELGEVEAALSAHPAVRESLVLVRDGAADEKDSFKYRVTDGDRAGEVEDYRLFLKGGAQKRESPIAGPQLVAYLVTHEGAAPNTSELRRFLKESLPEYMIPSAFVTLDAFPLSPNGKIDRRALPEPGDARPVLEREYVAPTTPVEKALAEVWSEVLGISQVGANDNYFELGGDSIRSIQVRAQARERGLHFSLQQMFQFQTVAELARELTVAEAGSLPSSLTEPFGLLAEEDLRRVPAGVEDAYPLARVQAGLIYHCQVNPDPAMYHDVFVYHLRARLDLEALRAALQQVIDRHPILRTSFDLVNFTEPLQLVHRNVPARVEVFDLSHLPAAEQTRGQNTLLEAERNRALDLSQAPLIRFFIHRLGDESFSLVLSFHDTILDGWSTASMLTELLQRYSSGLAGNVLPPESTPAVTFRDFVALERATIGDERVRQFWVDKLSDCDFWKLPQTTPSTAAETSRVGALHVPVSEETSEGLLRLARLAGVPLKHVLLGAHLKVLSFVSGQRDVLTGLESNGRLEEAEGERALGVHINTVPFRQQLRGGTWAQLAREAFETERELLPFRRYPLFEVQKSLEQRALLDTVFNYTHFHVFKNLQWLNLEVRGARGFEQTSFAFRAEFNLNPFSDLVQLDLACDLTRLSQERLEKIGHYYAETLARMAAESHGRYESFAPLSPDEERKLLREWNDTAAEFPLDNCLPELFEAQVSRTPEKVAVVAAGERLTYHELNARADKLSGVLARRGIGPEALTALFMPRGAHLLTAILAVFKAGGAYLPLDPTYPAARLSQILGQSKSRLVLITEELRGRLDEALSQMPREERPVALSIEDLLSGHGETVAAVRESGPANAAYVIYTSGSTGTPKGATVEQRGMVNHLFVKIKDLGLTENAVVAQTASQCFDISVWQFLAALLVGGRVVIVEDETAQSPPALLEMIEREGVSVVELVPSMLRATLDEIEMSDAARPRLSSLRWMIATGEALPPELCRRWLREFPHVPMLNAYGPTECSDDVTHYAFGEPPPPDAARMPIGRAVQNMCMYILDGALMPVPVGVSGELYVGGVGVGRGYLNDAARTASAFLPDPFGGEPGGRLYKTGDLARYLPDGNLEYLGRVDYQVKVRGFRIELGEIETVLNGHDALSTSVVQVREDERGVKRLVAYVVPRRGVAVTAAELRDFLGERVPAYMVPHAFVTLEALPTTPNGKIDVKRLPAPEEARPGGDKLASILGRLERLSDEEVRALLAQRQAGMRSGVT